MQNPRPALQKIAMAGFLPVAEVDDLDELAALGVVHVRQHDHGLDHPDPNVLVAELTSLGEKALG